MHTDENRIEIRLVSDAPDRISVAGAGPTSTGEANRRGMSTSFESLDEETRQEIISTVITAFQSSEGVSDDLYLSLFNKFNLDVTEIDTLMAERGISRYDDIDTDSEHNSTDTEHNSTDIEHVPHPIKRKKKRHPSTSYDLSDASGIAIVEKQSRRWSNLTSKPLKFIGELMQEFDVSLMQLKKDGKMLSIESPDGKVIASDIMGFGPLFDFVRDCFDELTPNPEGITFEQFQVLLSRLQVNVPRCLAEKIFAKATKSRSLLWFEDFVSFLVSKSSTVLWDDTYEVEIEEFPFGIMLENDPNRSDFSAATYVCDIANGSEAHKKVLMGSEILEINHLDVSRWGSHKVKARLLSESKHSMPVHVLFRKHIDRRNIDYLQRRGCWLLLEAEIGRLRNRKAKTQDNEEKPEFPHCPPAPGWRYHVYMTLESEDYSTLSRITISFIMFLIFFSTATFILETVPSLEGSDAFVYMEYFVSLCFSIEYFLKVISCNNLWLFFWDPMSLVDFFAVIPFWIELSLPASASAGGVGVGLRVIRVIRLTRLVRLVRNPQVREAMTVLLQTGQRSSPAFGLLGTLFFLFIVVSASVVYSLEKGQQNKDGLYIRSDGSETSIPNIAVAIYWCIVTISSVGYGDMYPIEIGGQIWTGFSMISGVLLISLSIIIVGGEFTKLDQEKLERSARVDHYDIYDYFQELNRTINEVCEKGNKDIFIDYFTDADVRNFIRAGFRSEEELFGVFRKQQLQCLPKYVKKKKLFYLNRLFGMGLMEADSRVKYVKDRILDKIQFAQDSFKVQPLRRMRSSFTRSPSLNGADPARSSNVKMKVEIKAEVMINLEMTPITAEKVIE